jgi:hypothetical protein
VLATAARWRLVAIPRCVLRSSVRFRGIQRSEDVVGRETAVGSVGDALDNAVAGGQIVLLS